MADGGQFAWIFHLDSAHAILQVSKEKFVADLSPSFASEKACLDVYDQAAANYMQALALFGDVHPSLHSTGATPDAPDLRELFGSLDSCDCEECNSIFSAAAYYTDCLDLLYQKATPVYNELVRRRPDLTKILLTCRNTNTAMPYIDLSLELLENFILSHRDVTIAVPAKFASDPFFKDPNYQTTWQATELAANPEHLNYYAYELLKTSVYPESLPFNLPLEEARVYLKHLGAQRNQVMTTFFNGSTIAAFTDFNTCMERLLISPEETAILTGAKTGDGSATNGLWNFYGFDKETLFKQITDPMDTSTPLTAASWLDVLKNRVDIFLQQTGIRYKDLITLRLCDFINPITNIPAQKRKISIIANATVPADDQDTCKLNLLVLDGLDTNDLKKIYRFIRLWRKLNWTMYQLDLAMNAFAPVPDTVPAWQQTLTRISQSDAIAKQLHLPVETILAFYTTINTNSAYIDYFTADYPLVNSLYAKLFQNKQVIFPTDAAFADPAALAGNLDDHIPAILAALQINAKDYNDLKTNASVITGNKLTLANLSALYRNAILANRLQLSIKDFLSVKSLTGIDPFADTVTTFTFLSKVDSLKTSGFSIDLVNYLLRHSFQAETGVAPTDEEIGLFLSELRAALRGIQTLTPELQKNTIAQKFSEKLKISTSSAIKLLHVYLPSGVAPANPLLHIEDDFWATDFSLSPFLKTYDDPVNPSLKIEPSKFVRANAVGTEVQVLVLFDNYMRIAKIATFVNQLKLTDDELENILINSTAIGCTKLNSLPVVSTVNGNFDAFEILVNLIRARDLLPLGTPPLFDILNHAITPVANSLNSWLTGITTRTNWDVDIVTRLVIQSDPALLVPDGGILKTGFPKDFCNGDLLLRISNCISMLKRLGLAPALVAATIQQDLIPGTSQAIKNAAKSKYDEAQWLKLAKPLRDVLRNRQRESLLAYTIYRPDNTQNERWKNSNGIYDYFLIDMEMQPISITSRIKQAICSVQLFIDRVLMNLEFQKNVDATQPHLQVNKEFSDQWNEWRKLYRIWEANRQVFCYPENYILPELRKDKSPIFKDLETDLNQNELNDDNVEAAFGHYLEQLDEVARLEVVGLYHQKENATAIDEAIDILHVFARTYSHPQKYFHRTLEKGEWTPWQKLTIDVDGDHIIPVVFNGRLCLFWLFFNMQSEANNSINPTSSVNSPAKQWHIQVAWSVYHNGKWKGKRLSKKYIKTELLFNEESVLKFQKEQIFVKSEITSNNILRLHIQDVYALTRHPAVANFVSGSFVFDNLNSEPDLEPAIFNLTNDIDNDAIRFPCIPPSETTLVNMQFESNTINQNFFADHVYELNNSGYHLYSDTPGFGVLHNLSNGLYHLVVPSNFKINPLESEFFFQDSKSTFYVLSGLVPSVTVNTPGIRTFFPGITEVLPPYRFKGIIPDPAPREVINHNDPELFFRRQGVTDFVSKGLAANTFNRINTL